MSRAAGYADFFPAAPSVIAEKERAARERAAQDAYMKDPPRGTLGTSNGNIDVSYKASSNRVGSILTPNTTTSSPPAVLSPTNRYDAPLRNDAPVGDPPPPSIMTPKATPPASSDPTKKNLKCTYDPELEPKGALKKSKKPIYRVNGEGVCLHCFTINTTRWIAKNLRLGNGGRCQGPPIREAIPRRKHRPPTQQENPSNSFIRTAMAL